MASKQAMVGSFIGAAPPGELHNVVDDVKHLTKQDPSLLQSQEPAFKKYNEEQFATVKLPNGSGEVIISPYNSIGDGRYYDTESQSSFAFDHTSQVGNKSSQKAQEASNVEKQASSIQPHSLDSKHLDLVTSLLKAYSTHASEHFPGHSLGVFPTENDSKIAFVLVANKYSPNNFWNGRWRSHYLYDPSNGSLAGNLKVDVHYYEDGNVRLTTDKPVSVSISTGNATDVVKQIAQVERRYQEDLNRAFTSLSEGAFKSLRRQLPVTRQKIEWEKVAGYRLGQDISGGRSR
ncbi:MAG: F-actin-capping protein subunit alpha [Chrysothrix sp. TS-e1954]|nr:MAG: F-actin-capping protein subunit alpha [Chrysothrix sp. TS-e1954]